MSIKNLTAFFNRIGFEETINSTHISLYVSIFQCWNLNRFQNPIQVSREELMKISKIGSNSTYHRCIRDLENLGFINYDPSYNPFAGTSITVVNLTETKKMKSVSATSTPTVQVKKPTHSKNVQVEKQPIYNNKIYKKNNNISIDKINIDNKETCSKNEQLAQMNDKPDLKEKRKIPSLKKVKEYFVFQKNSEFEAERFFNYYSSNGWLIGGKTKMMDWRASANNWMLNTAKFASVNPKNMSDNDKPKAQNLNATTNKNYSEPL